MADHPEIDKDQLYGKFQAGEDRRQKLHERIAHKSFDLAQEEDLNITHNKTTTGIGTWGAIGIAAATGIPSVALAGLLLYQMFAGADKPAAPPTDSEYEVLFFDREGKPIDVQPLQPKAK